MTLLLRAPTQLFSSKSGFEYQGASFSSAICTIGNFDGLHLGHQALIRKLVATAQKEARASVVISFYPHPLKLLKPGFKAEYLTSLRTRLEVLAELGVDVMYLVRFSQQLAALTPTQFVDSILGGYLHCQSLIIGPDLRIGKGRAGTPEVLKQLCDERGWGFQVGELELDQNGDKIGSRQIREMLNAGALEQVTARLGRPFVLEGMITHGAGRGKTIGFPTANLHLGYTPPLRKGVYAVTAHIGSNSFPAVTNVGTRPTFGGGGVSVETHLFDVKDVDCYDQRMKLEFHSFLRPEQKFDSVEALRSQIEQDVTRARELRR